jgi:hypothetical protein
MNAKVTRLEVNAARGQKIFANDESLKRFIARPSAALSVQASNGQAKAAGG